MRPWALLVTMTEVSQLHQVDGIMALVGGACVPFYSLVLIYAAVARFLTIKYHSLAIDRGWACIINSSSDGYFSLVFFLFFQLLFFFFFSLSFFFVVG